MNAEFQTWFALALVVLAAGLLVRGVWKRRHKPGCGGGCGCAPDKFKAKLKP